jgi:hypothetical protein
LLLDRLADSPDPTTQIGSIAPVSVARETCKPNQAQKMNKTIRKLRIIDLEKPDLSQSRVSTDPETIAKYKAAWQTEESDFFPAIVVFQDGQKYHIADGFHRVQSLMLADLKQKVEHRTIACDVRSGTLEQAIAYSLSANLKHGLLPSTADKKRAILLYYGLNPDHCANSNNAVAKACGCSHTFVGAWKTTCATMPVSITAAETKIPPKILEQTIANLKAAIAEGKIVTTRGGKELVQSERISSKALEPAISEPLPLPETELQVSSKALSKPYNQLYIVTTTNSVIPRGTVIEGFESLTSTGNVAIEWQLGTEVIPTTDLIEIPYPIEAKVTPLEHEKELTVTGYALVASDLKIKSIDKHGFAMTHSSTMLKPFIKKTLEPPNDVPPVHQNNIDAAELPATPILNLLSLTDDQLLELQFDVEQETLRRARLSEDTADLAIS